MFIYIFVFYNVFVFVVWILLCIYEYMNKMVEWCGVNIFKDNCIILIYEVFIGFCIFYVLLNKILLC